MQFRDHPAVQGKRDMYPVDPRKLKVDDSYNVRDMQAKETRDHIAWLKASIIAGGVHTPLEVRLDGKNIFVVAGHCRLAAVLEAVEEGHPIATVPCIPEAKGTDEIDRTVNLVISNSGKPLSPLEVAKVVKRLDGFGWSAKQIADRLGWKSVASVKQHLEMLELSEPVKQHIRAGSVSATTARRLAKSDLTAEQQDELIRANEEENRRIKGKKNTRTKVTPKTLKRNAPNPPATEARAEPQSAPEPAATTETVSVSGPAKAEIREWGDEIEQALQPMPAPAAEQAQPPIRAAKEPAFPPATELSEASRTLQEHIAPPRHGLKDIFEAIAPIAVALALTDLNQVDDDASVIIEISATDAKRFSLVWSKATGDDVKDAA